MLHDLFKFTTADENGGLGWSVGADRGTAVPRTAASLTRVTAATERGGHREACIFMKGLHYLTNRDWLGGRQSY